jgi:hypothetical protein
MLSQRHRSWRLLAAAAVVVVAAATGVATTVTSAAAATGCRVTYTVGSQWQGGFSANVTLTNLGDPLSSWTLTWSYGAGQQVTQAWNAAVSQSGSQVTAGNASYNGSLATGAGASFGFNGSWTGSNPAPSSFAMNGTACTGQPSDESSTPGPGSQQPPIDNPAWGRELPPAGAEHSMAYHLILSPDPKGYNPRSGECSNEIHARYWTYGPDGKVYPTWHPTQDASGCSFGHEHGDDPRTSDLFSTVGWPAFGYTSEVMVANMPESSHRHEDHVGHKVLAVNNSNVIQGDNGGFFPPSGTVLATCDILQKIHQGTHSPDAFTNNIHELLNAIRCTANGQTVEARFSLMMPFGRAGGFSPSECPGFGRPFINVAPPVPADSPSETVSLGRLIAESSCVDAIRRGDTHQDPLYPNPVPFNVSDMDDFWFGNVQVSGSGLSFSLSPLFYVVNSSRYYDPAKPDRLGRIVDLCYDTSLLGGFNCDEVLQQGGRIAWDDPRSPFKGTLREFRPGTFALQNSGPTTIYTDVYGRNASSTPFAGSIQQYFSGNTQSSGSQWFLRGATRDWDDGTVHAPN